MPLLQVAIQFVLKTKIVERKNHIQHKDLQNTNLHPVKVELKGRLLLQGTGTALVGHVLEMKKHVKVLTNHPAVVTILVLVKEMVLIMPSISHFLKIMNISSLSQLMKGLEVV